MPQHGSIAPHLGAIAIVQGKLKQLAAQQGPEAPLVLTRTAHAPTMLCYMRPT